MAIFVFIGWVFQAAEYLGIIESDPQDPDSRAYRLAHQGLALIKAELIDVEFEVTSETRLRKLTPAGNGEVLEVIDNALRVNSHSTTRLLLELGPGGGAFFRTYESGALEIEIRARTHDGGRHDIHLLLPRRRNATRQTRPLS